MTRSIEGTDRRQRFDELCRALRPDLYRFVYWLSRDRTITEDVVQETLLRAWRALDDLKEERATRHWLFTIARREHARLYERKRLETVDIDTLIAREEPMLAAAEEPELEELRRELFKLEDDYREPLVMQVLLGFTAEEIARELGLSTGAVLTRLFRARNQLRKVFAERDAGKTGT